MIGPQHPDTLHGMTNHRALAVLATVFLIAVTGLYVANYAVTSWFDDDIIFAAHAAARADATVWSIVAQGLADRGELYSPFITIPLTLLFKIVGNDSAAIKVVVSILVFANAALLFAVLRQVAVPRPAALAGAVLCLTAPALLEAWSWVTAMQHLMTVGLCLALVAVLIAILNAREADKPVWAWIALADVIAILAGFGREVAVIAFVGIVAVSVVYCGRSWRLGALLASPAFMILPQQAEALLGWLNGHQVMRLMKYLGWEYGGSLDGALRNVGIEWWLLYGVVAVAQIVLVVAARSDGPRPFDRIRPLVRYASCTGLATLYLWGLGSLPVVAAASVSPWVADFHLSASWVVISVPWAVSLLFAAALIAGLVHKGTPWLLAPLALLFESATSLYLQANAEFFANRMGDIDGVWLFSRYAAYALPFVAALLAFCLSRAALFWPRAVLLGVALLALGNVASFTHLAAVRAAQIPAPFYPALLAQYPCPVVVDHWRNRQRGYGVIEGLTIPDTIIHEDATVRRFLAGRPDTARVWAACAWRTRK